MVCRQISYKVEQPEQIIKTAILKNGHNSNIEMPVIDTWVNTVKADAEGAMRREDDRHVNFYLL